LGTKQQAAIVRANQLIGLCQTLQTTRSSITDFIKAYNSEGYSTVWAGLATAAQNPDGSLGTADGSPNTAHPIDTRVITGLNAAVSETQLVAGVTLLTQLQNFFGNLGVTTGNYSQNLDDLAG
jgi:hypothetical protein